MNELDDIEEEVLSWVRRARPFPDKKVLIITLYKNKRTEEVNVNFLNPFEGGGASIINE